MATNSYEPGGELVLAPGGIKFQQWNPAPGAAADGEMFRTGAKACLQDSDLQACVSFQHFTT